MCGGPWQGLECLGGRRNGVLAGGWALAIPISGVLGGWLGSTQYSPPSTHPAAHPWYTPPHRTCTVNRLSDVHAAVLTCSLASPKEILGVDNAQCTLGSVGARLRLCPHCGHLTPQALRPAPWRLLNLNLSISQYISVISQFI